MNPQDFAEKVWKQYGSQSPFRPCVNYDPDGDCLEFFGENEPFLAERLDKWVTVYRSRSTSQIIGSLIKNVRELVATYPALKIDIENGPVRLAHILLAPSFTASTKPTYLVYRQIIEKAQSANVEASLSECAR